MPVLVAGLILCGLEGVGFASLINIKYSGEIDRLSYSERIGSSYTHTNLTESSFYEGFKISEGENFSGNFSYDSNAPLTGISSDGDSGIYLSAVTNFFFLTEDFSLPSLSLPTASGRDILVSNDGTFGWDTFYVSNWFSNDSWFASITIDLMDRDGTVYDTFSMPSTFNLDDFETLYFHMAFLRKEDQDQLHLYGYLSDFSVTSATPVPEPSAILLLGTGLVILAGSRLKRKKSLV